MKTKNFLQALSAIFLVAALEFPNSAAAQTVISVSNVTELMAAVSSANTAGGNRVIRIQDGTYTLPDTLYVNAPNVSLIGASGDRQKVTIQGDAMSANAVVGNVIRVAAKGFTLQHLTLARSRYHLIQVTGENDSDNAVIRDCILRDSYEQMVKISLDVDNPVSSADNGLVENCIFEYSAGIGPQYYIGGVDGHGAKNWVIRGNTFRNIKSPEARTAEHAVHFWTNSADIIVERNLFIDCDRGVGFGMLDPSAGRGALRGIIRNNMIYSSAAKAGPATDVGIAIENSPGTQIYNNTVILQNGYPAAIEYRFATTTGVKIYNNFTNVQIRARDGAVAELVSNRSNATAADFADLAAGNLHLTASSLAVNTGTALPELTNDFDGQARPQGGSVDVGADEYTPGRIPNPPTDLDVE